MIFVAVTASTVCALGMPLAVQRYVSDSLGAGDGALARYIVTWGQRFSILPGCVAGGMTLLVGTLYQSDRVLDWVLSAVYAAAATVHSVNSQALLGLRQYRSASVTGVATQLLAVPVTIVLLFNGQGVTAVIAVVMAAALVSTVVTMWLLRRASQNYLSAGDFPKVATDRSQARRLVLRFASGAGILVLLDTVVAQRSEFAFLALYHGNEPAQLAFYGVAFSATQTAYRLPAALIPVILPTVSALLAAGKWQIVRDSYARVQRILLFVSAIGAGLLLGCGSSFITLVWGGAYETAGHVLLLCAVIPVLVGSLGAMASATVLGGGHLRAVICAQAIGAGVTLAADAILIWPFAALGAAIASSIGMAASTMALLIVARRTMQLPILRLTDFLRCILLVLLIATPGLVSLLIGLGHPLTLAVGLVGGVLILGVAYPVIKPLLNTDLQVAARVIDRLPRSLRSWISLGNRPDPDEDVAALAQAELAAADEAAIAANAAQTSVTVMPAPGSSTAPIGANFGGSDGESKDEDDARQ